MIDGGPGWHIDPGTLRPTITDERLFRTTHADDPALEVLVALWSGDPDNALTGLEQLLRAAPAHWRWRALEADAWRDLGHHQRAVDEYRHLVSEHVGTTHEAVLVQHLGKAHFAAGEFAAAGNCFARALDLRVRAGAEPSVIESSRAALDRARELSASTCPDDA